MTADALRGSLLEDAHALLLLPSETVQTWGRTLVIAPHPDDESLACGGALALLAQCGVPARVLCVTDGTLSHPNSQEYPAPRLKSLREAELRHALLALGMAEDSVQFLEYRDRHAPMPGNADFADAVRRVAHVLADWPPQTILAPWRRDPHPDHRSAFVLVQAALRQIDSSSRLLEWPLWTWAMADPADAPRPEEASAFRLDIAPVLDKKRAAIACHASQVTDLICDDPHGFRLTPDVLAHFLVPHETFIECRV